MHVNSVRASGLHGVLDTFNCAKRLVSSVPCLIGLCSALADLIEQDGICSIVRRFRLDWGLSLFAWYAMPAVNRARVFVVFGSRWLPHGFVRGVVSGLLGPA